MKTSKLIASVLVGFTLAGCSAMTGPRGILLADFAISQSARTTNVR
jgi:hypothetical protein